MLTKILRYDNINLFTKSEIEKGGDFMTIGEKLKKLRGNKRQIEIAKELGILPSAYSNYENDYRIPNDETKKKIADYYKKTVDEIFF